MRIPVSVTIILSFYLVTAHAENLVSNGDFSGKTEAGLPVGWTVVGEQKVTLVKESASEGSRQCLRVDVLEDGGSSYGQIYQDIKAKPNTLYLLLGKTRSTKSELVFFSIKLRKNRNEI